MFTNTGTTSFILYAVFILITIVAMVIAFSLILKGTIPDTKLDKLIEIFKYSIVTVAIATVTLVVSDLFKEREQDVKELEYFDRYVEDVKKVDGIESRFLLAKYLSIVAPSGELKRSWREYYDTTKPEYEEYLKLKNESKRLDTITNPTQEQQLKKLQVDEIIEKKEAPLVAPSVSLIPRVYIHIAEENQRAMATSLQSQLRNEHLTVPGIENVGKNPKMFIPNATEVRYYREEELPDAIRLVSILKNMNLKLKLNEVPLKISGTGRGTRPGHYEIWFSKF